MPLKTLPFTSLKSLLKHQISKKEEVGVQELIDKLSIVRKRKYLTKPEFEEICRWKSPRAIRLIQSNQAKRIESITRLAFATRSEQKRLSYLTELQGVSVPMASAIMMLTNPKRYGVIDIRVWQLLHTLGTVNTNADGAGFNFKQWYRFLKVIRYYARKYKVHARDIERTLFKVHSKYQKGRLYKK